MLRWRTNNGSTVTWRIEMLPTVNKNDSIIKTVSYSAMLCHSYHNKHEFCDIFYFLINYLCSILIFHFFEDLVLRRRKNPSDTFVDKFVTTNIKMDITYKSPYLVISFQLNWPNSPYTMSSSCLCRQINSWYNQTARISQQYTVIILNWNNSKK